MENITKLREALIKNYESIMSGEIDVKKAKEVNNTAGKMLSSCSVSLKYHAQMGYVGKKIDYLE